MMEKITKFSESLTKSTKIFQLVGLQLFAADSKSESGFKLERKISRRHKSSFIFGLIFFTLTVFGGNAIAVLMNFDEKHNANVLKSLAAALVAYIGMATAIFCAFLNSLLKVEKSKEIFRHFETIAKVFVHDLKMNLSYDRFSRNFGLFFMQAVTIYTMLSVLLLIFVYFHNQSAAFLWPILSFIEYFYTLIYFSYFIFFISLLRENLIFIKNELKSLKKSHELLSDYPRVISVRRNYEGSAQEQIERINKLKKIYSILCDATDLVNNFFGVPVLMILVILVEADISAGFKVFLIKKNDFQNIFISARMKFGQFLGLLQK